MALLQKRTICKIHRLVDVGIAFAEALAIEAKVFKMIGLAKLWGIIPNSYLQIIVVINMAVMVIWDGLAGEVMNRIPEMLRVS